METVRGINHFRTSVWPAGPERQAGDKGRHWRVDMDPIIALALDQGANLSAGRDQVGRMERISREWQVVDIIERFPAHPAPRHPLGGRIHAQPASPKVVRVGQQKGAQGDRDGGDIKELLHET